MHLKVRWWLGPERRFAARTGASFVLGNVAVGTNVAAFALIPPPRLSGA